MSNKTPIYFIHNNYNHPPQALGMIQAYAEVFQNGILNKHCHFLPWNFRTEEELRLGIKEHGKGIFLFSHYLWSESYCLEMAALVHEILPGAITIHGGPSVPNYLQANRDYFATHPQVDITVRGEGEVTCAELLYQLVTHTDWNDRSFLKSVEGISFRTTPNASADIVRTPDRARVQNLDELPSPYLSGSYDQYDHTIWDAVILETNRGCPYGCTFCDWGAATKQKIRKFDLERVFEELEWIGKRQIPILWIADANFGIFPRDVDITQKICEIKSKYGFPKQIINNYTKNATKRLAEIIGLLHKAEIDAPGIIAIQTTDKDTLEAIDRKNIKTERYEELAEIFRKEQLPMTTDLMIGLPGATCESFLNDIQFFVDRYVTIKAYRVQVIPNSPMADPDYIKRYQLKTDPKGYVQSSSTFTVQDLDKMIRFYMIYQLFFSFGIKKYLLYFLQFEHEIHASHYIRDLTENLYEKPVGFFPYTLRLIEEFARKSGERQVVFSESHWVGIYKEAEQFIDIKYGIKPSTVLSTILRLQKSLMPSSNRTFPDTHAFDFDVASYFQQFWSLKKFPAKGDLEIKESANFSPGTLTITDPQDICKLTAWRKADFYDNRTFKCELNSSINTSNQKVHNL